MAKFTYSTIALSVLGMAIAGCNPAQTANVTVPSSGPSVLPSASPTASTPVITPSATGAAQASTTPAPSVSAAGTGDRRVVLSGTVFDEKGATVDDAVVSVRSLDDAVPYAAAAKTIQGSYVVNDLPEGANVSITVTKKGYTTRKRVGAFSHTASAANEINFGSALTVNDDAGSAYFISRYPEVMATEPVYNATLPNGNSLTYKLKLSEPLDETNRRRFEEAIRIMPANAEANPSGAAPRDFSELTDADKGHDWNLTTVVGSGLSGNLTMPYWIQKGSLLMNELDSRTVVTWNDEGSEATVTFKLPLATSKTDAAKYQVGLVAPADGSTIQDADGNQLGTDKDNSLTGYPAAGNLIYNAFVPASLSIVGNPANGAARWAATHKSVSTFWLAQDVSDPKLVKVGYTKNLGGDSRFEFTFDKPMVAFNATSGGRMDGDITNGNLLKNVSFAISERVDGTKNVNLKGGAGLAVLDPRTTTNYGSDPAVLEREFLLDSAAFTSVARKSLTGADTGKITIEPDPLRPATVLVYIYDRPNIFATNIGEIKVRAEAIADPAGNAITSADADRNQVVGAF